MGTYTKIFFQIFGKNRNAIKINFLVSPLNFNVQNVAYHFYLVNIRDLSKFTHVYISKSCDHFTKDKQSVDLLDLIMTENQELCFSGITGAKGRRIRMLVFDR